MYALNSRCPIFGKKIAKTPWRGPWDQTGVVPGAMGRSLARTIAIANQKGGVGKTTTTINFSASLASRGFRVLLVDFDPQGNASSGVGWPASRTNQTIYDALTGTPIRDVIQATEIQTLFVAPANMELVGAEIELIGTESRERYLERTLAPVRGEYDYIIIDCPPSLGLLTLNALVAADSVIVPMQAEYFALEGLSALSSTIEKVRAAYNAKLEIDGVLFTMFDLRTNLSVQVRDEVVAFFGNKVFQTSVPRNVRLSEAPSHGKPVLLYDLRCPGTKAYLSLAEEYVARRAAVPPFVATGTAEARL